MQSGPRRTSNEEKSSRGTLVPSRASEKVVNFPAVVDIPKPPAVLNRDGKALWKDLAPSLFTQRVMTIADVHSFTHLCQLHGELIAGYRHNAGATAAQINALRLLFCEFGMTPASRCKAPGSVPDALANRFGRNGGKKDSSAKTGS